MIVLDDSAAFRRSGSLLRHFRVSGWPLASGRSAPAEPLEIAGGLEATETALALAAAAVGGSDIANACPDPAVAAMAAGLRSMGVSVDQRGNGDWHLAGRGIGGMAEPEDAVTVGTTLTGLALTLGLLAGQPTAATLRGPDRIRQRDLSALTRVLVRFGAEVETRSGGRLPIRIRGTANLRPATCSVSAGDTWALPGLWLAALAAPGRSTTIEAEPLEPDWSGIWRAFGAGIRSAPADGGRATDIDGHAELVGTSLRLPGDAQIAAALAVVLASVSTTPQVLSQVHRDHPAIEVVAALRSLGADIEWRPRSVVPTLQAADLAVGGGRLKGGNLAAAWPQALGRCPALVAAAALAEGTTVFDVGAGEASIDPWLAVMALAGVRFDRRGRELIVTGNSGRRLPGGAVLTVGDDLSSALAAFALALAAEAPTTVSVDATVPGLDNAVAAIRRAGSAVEEQT
jgi:3-phosphoshikimate 1-carboxyvinyltransferase